MFLTDNEAVLVKTLPKRFANIFYFLFFQVFIASSFKRRCWSLSWQFVTMPVQISTALLQSMLYKLSWRLTASEVLQLDSVRNGFKIPLCFYGTKQTYIQQQLKFCLKFYEQVSLIKCRSNSVNQ